MLRTTGKMALKMIDIGANLTDPVFTGTYRGKQKHESDLTAILARAKAFGVDKIIVTGGNLEESKAALQLAKNNEGDGLPQLFSTVGVHPTRCSEFEADGRDPDAYFAELSALCEQGKNEGKVVAIGECGLDYDRLEFCDRETQLKYFEKQFQLAEHTKLPLFLHNRNTDGDFYAMIAKNRSRFSNGVVHSFTGSKEEMLKLVEFGLYIGVNGCSLKTADNLECMKAIPLDRLMIETDAPWCDIRAAHAGHGHVKTSWQSKKAEKYAPDCLVKGRNEPCTLIQVLEIISAIRGEDQDHVAATVLENTLQVLQVFGAQPEP
ncbi:putative deoxyribonuclease [Phytophthora fragariae]|uniref:Putative deoxyribonuclease n=1 Tax=Phytophthora fragariae TaxID=53985 RepID=A0A6A3KK83_9STRA|nr:putative deoxyribonuclease [Phytophthora fragariae]KAE9005405.1 putative deoxyribonuclease [Phytophthora fragariae]KAE9106319.1 putative deoxyribonuclease [Phytophthora fragariae]KAE9142597.1 putative deoxyribonuclease [Phytophthora fragariae]KAE9206040.1 putative deoxyribonuclease [Phytophthora fragariae]